MKASPSTVAVCSIGSTDPWNAAGLGLDIRALAECGVRPLTVVAGVTAQDKDGVAACVALSPAAIAAQLAALRDAEIGAFRIGALLDAPSVDAVARYLADVRVPVVLDPVLGASGGGAFGDEATRVALRERLLPCVTLVTPNLDEAAFLGGISVVDDVDAMERAGVALRALGAGAALVKGGHLPGATVDVLVDGGETLVFEAPRLPGTLRGTGCLLGCAVAAALARGEPLHAAVEFARAFVRSKFTTAHDAGGMRLAY